MTTTTTTNWQKEKARCKICNKLIRTHGSISLTSYRMDMKNVGVHIPKMLPDGDPDCFKLDYYLCHKCYDSVIPPYDKKGKWISRTFLEEHHLIERAIFKEKRNTSKNLDEN